MSIEYSEESQHFHLKTPSSSYIIAVKRGRYLAHMGWGRRIHSWEGPDDFRESVDRPFAPNPAEGDRLFSLDTLPQECPTPGRGDFRMPAMEILMPDGTTAMDAWYAGHRILAGKPRLEDLPATWVEHDGEADTLEIDLLDRVHRVLVTLSYTVWRDRDVITRSARITNEGEITVFVRKAMSASIDFPCVDYSLLQLSGAHCRERRLYQRKLFPGLQGIESKRGASSHQQHPFLALLSPGATEDWGEVFAFNLVYSGNFSAMVETDQYGSPRLQMGINPHDFSWSLSPGKAFQTPELVMVRSEEGLGGMSRTFHGLYRKRLCRGRRRDTERPIVINNWEATYFDFDEVKLLALADEAAVLGIELFILDDGWFGMRDSDNGSLGDWKTDTRKLPGGLGDFADKIRARGMGFGLWVEPEMVSRNSDLFRAHPDWCLQIPRREASFGRDQLVLDLSRTDVREYLFDSLSAIFTEAKAEYVKWDMNRHMTEVGSLLLPSERQQETAHRYMLGLYELLERITEAFPDILFESCSGGGGRYDPGMLYYMPQTWTSDNTDPLNRTLIQFGTSLLYPPNTMSCHVSASPNHQTGRSTSLKTRGNVAMAGTFGYELDLTKLSRVEKTEIAEQIRRYKSIRGIVLNGEQYRLVNPSDTPALAAWMSVSLDKGEALVTAVCLDPEPNTPWIRLRLKGLEPSARYRCETDGRFYNGDELMEVGIKLLFQASTEGSEQIRFSME